MDADADADVEVEEERREERTSAVEVSGAGRAGRAGRGRYLIRSGPRSRGIVAGAVDRGRGGRRGVGPGKRRRIGATRTATVAARGPR